MIASHTKSRRRSEVSLICLLRWLLRLLFCGAFPFTFELQRGFFFYKSRGSTLICTSNLRWSVLPIYVDLDFQFTLIWSCTDWNAGYADWLILVSFERASKKTELVIHFGFNLGVRWNWRWKTRKWRKRTEWFRIQFARWIHGSNLCF